MQQIAEKKDTKAFYNGLREVYGPQRRGTTQLTDLDGETIIQEKAEILHRFTNYFDKLLNITGEVPAPCRERHYTETKHCIS